MNFINLCMGCMQDKGNNLVCPICGYDESEQINDLRCLLPKTILNGQYLIGKVIGQGGFGITYIAYDLNLETKVAIKEYMPEGLVTRTMGMNTVTAYTVDKKPDFHYGMEKFLDEAKMMAKFNEVKSIVSVRNFFKENGTAYFVMDFVEGTNLATYLREKGGKLQPDEALKLVGQVIDALEVVHESGMLHRDVSPDNIYLTRNGSIKLLDFGAARYAIGEQRESLSVILKPGYAPEEQYRSKGIQGPWTDIYATAATLYKLITGQTPPESMDRLHNDDVVPPTKLGANILQHIEYAILKALSVKAENRFQSMQDFRNALNGGMVSEGSTDTGNQASLQKVGMVNSGVHTAQQIEQPAREVRKKKSSVPMIIGIAVAVFIIACAAGAYFVPELWKPDDISKTVSSEQNENKADIINHNNKEIQPEKEEKVDESLIKEDEESCKLIKDIIGKCVKQKDLLLPLRSSYEVTGEILRSNKSLPKVKQYDSGFFEIKKDASEVRVRKGNEKTDDGYIRIGVNDKNSSDKFEDTPKDTVKNDKKIIKSSDGKFQVTVPGDWETDAITDTNIVFSAAKPIEEKYFAGSVEKKPTQSITLDVFAKVIQDGMKGQMQDAKFGKSEKLTLDGHSCIRFETTGTIKNQKLGYLVTMIDCDTHIVQLISWTLESNYSSCKEQFKQIHGTFKVNRVEKN